MDRPAVYAGDRKLLPINAGSGEGVSDDSARLERGPALRDGTPVRRHLRTVDTNLFTGKPDWELVVAVMGGCDG